MPQKSQRKPPLQPEDVAGILDRDVMITTRELAAYLRTSENELDLLASRGGGPPYYQSRPGARRLYAPADVKEWMKSRHFAATGEPLAASQEPAA